MEKFNSEVFLEEVNIKLDYSNAVLNPDPLSSLILTGYFNLLEIK